MAKKINAKVRLDDYRFPNTDIFSGRANVRLENGFVAKLGEVEEGNRDIRTLETPEVEGSVVLVAHFPLMYDESRLSSGQETNFFMEEGDAVRVYGVKPTMKFSVTKEAIEGSHVIGEYLVSGAGNKLVPSSTVPATGFAAKVVREDKVGGALALNVDNKPTTWIVLDTVQN